MTRRRLPINGTIVQPFIPPIVDRHHYTGSNTPPPPAPPRSVVDLIHDGVGAFKYLGGLAAAALLYADRAYEFIPVGAPIRKWGVIAAILAVVAGLGAHQSARRLREPSVGWGFFWLAVIDLLMLIVLVSVHLPPSMQAAASAAPLLYALLFILLGGALGGFLL